MSVWIVRAVAWYPRKPYNPTGKEPLVDRPKRPNPTPPKRWCVTSRGGPSRNLEIPVEAHNAEAAERLAKRSKYVEELRDIPTTKMQTLKPIRTQW